VTDSPDRPDPVTVRTAADAAALGTVLGVWAHPDDETYLSAGVMALARRAGRRVVCVSATKGELGTEDPERWPPGRLAGLRTHETRAAMAVLGVDDHRWLDLTDGTLADLEPGLGAERVAALLEEVRPDTVVTFGPEGMTGHPDHMAVAGWVDAAWRATGASARLLQATKTAGFAAEFTDIHEAVPIFGPGTPPATPVEAVALTVELDEDLADLKLAALRAHASQVQPILDRGVTVDRLREWIRVEWFRATTR
jgi:LmbE family N-acetylglucosaminyl deacetylase